MKSSTNSRNNYVTSFEAVILKTNIPKFALAISFLQKVGKEVIFEVTHESVRKFLYIFIISLHDMMFRLL